MKNRWDAQSYEDSFGFVPKYGEPLIDMLNLYPGIKVLDIGCGNGTLTNRLRELGADVVGIDSSPAMLDLAKKNYPSIPFFMEDATNLTFMEEFDVVFSNAVFHWIEDKAALANSIKRALKPGGQLVCELGGTNCAGKVHKALHACFLQRGLEYHPFVYFNSIGEFCTTLEQSGLCPSEAFLFPRETPLKEGEDVRDWIEMFFSHVFDNVDIDVKTELLEEVRQMLLPELTKDGTWFIDYTRLRVKAIKPN